MKRTDLYICGFMYLFCAFFQHETQKFPEGARHYPHFVIGLLFLLTTIRLYDMVKQYLKDRHVINDLSETFKGFQPKQFWTMFAAFLGFFALMYFYLYSVLPAILPYSQKVHGACVAGHACPDVFHLQLVPECAAAQR